MAAQTLISPLPDTPEVRVNGVVIEPEVIAAETQHHPASTPEGAWSQACEALAVREVLLQRARDLCGDVEPASGESPDDALIRVLLEKEVSVPEPDEDSCRRYYENNRAKLRSADLYEPAHILLQARRDDRKAYATARDEATALIGHLLENPAAFETIARERSDCRSGRDGGRLGQVGLGQTTPAFEKAMLAMSAGTLNPEPVETDYGVHILRLDRVETGEVPDFETARPLVEEFLRDASWRRAVAQFVSLLVGEAKIEGVELNGAASPLVQ